MANWFTRIFNGVYREYDRRVRRASQIEEYGAGSHHGHDDAPIEVTLADDEDSAEIVNVPRGTSVTGSAKMADLQSEEHHLQA